MAKDDKVKRDSTYFGISIPDIEKQAFEEKRKQLQKKIGFPVSMASMVIKAVNDLKV